MTYMCGWAHGSTVDCGSTQSYVVLWLMQESLKISVSVLSGYRTSCDPTKIHAVSAVGAISFQATFREARPSTDPTCGAQQTEGQRVPWRGGIQTGAMWTPSQLGQPARLISGTGRILRTFPTVSQTRGHLMARPGLGPACPSLRILGLNNGGTMLERSETYTSMPLLASQTSDGTQEAS